MTDYDVVIVGAGLTAAVAAAEAGARTLVFEREREVGGSMSQSAGMFTAVGTSVQKSLGIDDDPGRDFQHYMDLKQWRLRPGLIRRFCEQSAPTFEWLLGLGLSVPALRSTSAHMPGLTQAGVEDVWRGHVPEGEGPGLVAVLDAARRVRGAEVVFASRVEGLLADESGVHGIRVDDTDVSAGAVIVATGSMAQNRGLAERFYPDVLEAGPDLFAVSGAGSRGDHVRFAAQAGADMVGEGWGMLLLTACFQRHHHWQAGFPPPARVTVDAAGRRVMDEDASYAVGAGIAGDQLRPLWMIFDEAARTALAPGHVSWMPDAVATEARSGRTIARPTRAGLAAAMPVPAATLLASIERWNKQLPLTGVDPSSSGTSRWWPREPARICRPSLPLRIMRSGSYLASWSPTTGCGSARTLRCSIRPDRPSAGCSRPGKPGPRSLAPVTSAAATRSPMRSPWGGSLVRARRASLIGLIPPGTAPGRAQWCCRGGRGGKGSRDGVRRHQDADPGR